MALDGLDISVPRGELYGLVGPNGSGKTTTSERLTGQRTPAGVEQGRESRGGTLSSGRVQEDA
ncbi:MAG: ATP-binding cassette domain-containing protein [Halovenus sp.]